MTVTPIRILLVEDNPADADLTRETLELSKLTIGLDVAIDGIEALEYLRGKREGRDAVLPDLILLDLNLPRMDGKQFLAEMRSDKAFRNIPVVILTTSDAESDIIQGYSLGANCYVTKPVGLEAFQTIVQAVENFWFTVVKLPPPGVS